MVRREEVAIRSYEDRPEEDLLLKEATDAGVRNIAQYYHHETVSVRGTIDDVWKKTFGRD